jgi:hypothetical protein
VFSDNNVGNQYFEDLFIEIGAKPASGAVGLKLAGEIDELSLRRPRIILCNTGIQWTATANNFNAPGSETNIYQPWIYQCDTGLQSVSGDATYKIVYGGVINATTNLNPDPLTNTAFFKTKIGQSALSVKAYRGFTITTPSIPATNVAQNNTTGGDVQVFLNTQSVTAVKVDGTDTGWGGTLPTDLQVLVPAGGSITMTYAGTAPTWKWFGI